MRQKQKPKPAPAVEVVILAGGASSRMGRDKARVRLGGRSLLHHIRTAAAATGWPVRVLRHDAVRKCGPLGGVLTALVEHGMWNAERGTKADPSALRIPRSALFVFLSCDMPFVSAAMIRRIVRAVTSRKRAAFFTDGDGRAGFPFALRPEALPVVLRQVARGRYSLQELARAAGARRLPIPGRGAWRWFNVNTPADLAQARRLRSRMATAALRNVACLPGGKRYRRVHDSP